MRYPFWFSLGHHWPSGVLGPAADGYAPEQLLTPTEAARLHSAQLETFAEEGVDITSAFTITHPSEAIGMVNRARSWPAFRTVIHGGDRRAVADWAGPRFRAQRGRSRLAATFAITGSTAPIPSISANSCHRAGSTGLAWYGQTPRAAAMPNWTKPPSSMTVTRRSSLYAEVAERLPGLRVVGGCCGSDMRHIKALIAAGV